MAYILTCCLILRTHVLVYPALSGFFIGIVLGGLGYFLANRDYPP